MYPYFKGMVLKRQSIIEWIMHPKRYINLSHFFDNGNSKVNKRNIETIEEKRCGLQNIFL